MGRAWFSPAGANLYLSVALTSPGLESVLSLLPLAVGVAATEAIEQEAGVVATLKWPNDVYVDGLKLGGILCEGVTVGARFVGVVAGVGINVNVASEDVPAELADVLTSLRMLTGREHDPERLAHAVRSRVLHVAEVLRSGGASEVLRAWRGRDCANGRTVEAADGSFTGTACGVEDDGALRVLRSDGALIRVRSGEVRFVR